MPFRVFTSTSEEHRRVLRTKGVNAVGAVVEAGLWRSPPRFSPDLSSSGRHRFFLRRRSPTLGACSSSRSLVRRRPNLTSWPEPRPPPVTPLMVLNPRAGPSRTRRRLDFSSCLFLHLSVIVSTTLR